MLLYNKFMNSPKNKLLYNKIKNLAKRKFKAWPSAYASGWLVNYYTKHQVIVYMQQNQI